MILNQEVCGMTVTGVENGKVFFKKDGAVKSMNEVSYTKHVRNATINLPRNKIPFSEATRKKVVDKLRGKKSAAEAVLCLQLRWLPSEHTLSLVYSVMRTTTWTRLPSGVWYKELQTLPSYMTDPKQSSFDLEKTAPKGHVYNFSKVAAKQAPKLTVEDPITTRLRLVTDKAEEARKLRVKTMALVESKALRLQELIPAMTAEIAEQAKQNALSRAFGEPVVKNEHPACSEFFLTARELQALTH